MTLLIKEKKNKRPPFILTSPHSGVIFPDSFFENKNVNFDKEKLLMVSDLFVDELISDIKPQNLIKIFSQYSRSYIDLNRNINEIDKETVKNSFSISNKFSSSGYANNGYGLVHTKTFDQKDIYKNLLSWKDIETRIITIYKPWHKKLAQKIKNLRQFNNQIFLIDFHSMPSEIFFGNKYDKKDIILGDLFGKSSNSKLTNILKILFEESGFNVGKNIPYQGGFISKNYGNPSRGINAIQIEIRRDLYMNEEKLTKSNEFNKFKNKLELVIEKFIKMYTSGADTELAAQ